MSSSSNYSSSSSESEVEDSFNEESVECCGVVAHMTSLPKGLIQCRLFWPHSVIFESSNGGLRKPKNKAKIIKLPVRISR